MGYVSRSATLRLQPYQRTRKSIVLLCSPLLKRILEQTSSSHFFTSCAHVLLCSSIVATETKPLSLVCFTQVNLQDSHRENHIVFGGCMCFHLMKFCSETRDSAGVCWFRRCFCFRCSWGIQHWKCSHLEMNPWDARNTKAETVPLGDQGSWTACCQPWKLILKKMEHPYPLTRSTLIPNSNFAIKTHSALFIGWIQTRVGLMPLTMSNALELCGTGATHANFAC